MSHETVPIAWTSNVSNILRWLYSHKANWEPMALTDPPYRWGIVQRGQERFAMQPEDTLCWDGNRVWLHSSHRQEVETCEAKEARMLKKFGTGTITEATGGTEEGLTSRIGSALTPEEWASVLIEAEETDSEEE
ncbi:hypothetical protein BZZ08_01660 [Streptomyces sp. MH60]|nr:hypothetical protein BZZ08_01660 [Streptomyces sp. MH60]